MSLFRKRYILYVFILSSNSINSKPINIQFFFSELSKLYDEKSSDTEKIWGIKRFIRNCINSIISNIDIKPNQFYDSKDCGLLVRSLIHIHNNIKRIILTKFNNLRKYQIAMIEEFQSSINQYMLQMFAYYIHINLKQRNNIYGYNIINNIDDTLNELFMIYNMTLPIYNPHPFELYYHKYLEIRLLKQISNIKMEKLLINKYISNYCGYQFEQKLSTMINDAMSSKELSKQFNMQNQLQFEMNLTICSPDKWDIDTNKPSINLPNEIKNGCNKYVCFYKSNPWNHGKNLQFDMTKGDAMIEIDFNDKTSKTLIVSTLQMIVLTVFNDQNIWTFKQILEITNISCNELENVLLTMCHPKVGILLKQPNRRQFNANDRFCINSRYSNPNKLVFIPETIRNNKNKETQNEGLNYKTVMVEKDLTQYIVLR